MLLNCFLLAICVSIDSLSIGVTYGLKNTKISFGAKCILFCISIFITTFSVFVGSSITKLFPSYITCAIGSILLCLMGVWIIVQAITKNKDSHSRAISNNHTTNSATTTVSNFPSQLEDTRKLCNFSY